MTSTRCKKNLQSIFNVRDFIETILIKEDFDDPKERARRAAQKRKEKEEAAKKAMAASKLVSFHFIYGSK